MFCNLVIDSLRNPCYILFPCCRILHQWKCGRGGIGRRARFRSVWANPRGGSSPLDRIIPTITGFWSVPRTVWEPFLCSINSGSCSSHGPMESWNCAAPKILHQILHLTRSQSRSYSASNLEFSQFNVAASVITSYSIHYTKLYDGNDDRIELHNAVNSST